MAPVIPPDVLVILLSPDSTFDQRMAAALRLAAESWSQGWDAAVEAGLEAVQESREAHDSVAS